MFGHDLDFDKDIVKAYGYGTIISASYFIFAQSIIMGAIRVKTDVIRFYA